MFKVYLRKQGEYTFALILGPNAGPGEVDRWAEQEKYEKPADFATFSAAMQFAKERGTAVWSVHGIAGWPDIDQVDMDRLMKPN